MLRYHARLQRVSENSPMRLLQGPIDLLLAILAEML